MYADAMADADKVIAKVTTDSAWKRFDTPDFKGPIEKAQEDMKKLWGSDFGQAFEERHDINEVKKSMDSAEFMVAGKAFSSSMIAFAEDLKEECKSLREMATMRAARRASS
eukprot:64694-Pyramimonas_sp.AAC.1